MVRTPPPLFSLLRSENQVRVLAALILAPGRRYTVTELAETTGVPQPSVSREVARLLGAGAVVGEVEHRRHVYRANTESPIYPELASLLLKTVGPKAVLERLLTGVPRIVSALIYGSWARRYAGEPGPEPGDIDVMVVGTPDVARVRRLADQASGELGRDVNVTVLTPEEWAGRTSGFLRQVRSAPTVPLDLSSAEATG